MLKQLAKSLGRILNTGMYDYVNLEAPNNNYDFVTKSGGLSTVYQIGGSYSVVGDNSLETRIEDMVSSLKGLLASPGHRIQFVFVRDPEGSERDVKDAMAPSFATISRLNLEMNAMLTQRKKTISSKVSSERCFMILTTLHSVIPSAAAKEENEARMDRAKGLGVKPGEFGQSPFMNFTRVDDIHEGFITTFESSLREYIECRKLDKHEAIRSIKREINSSTTSSNWKPSLSGDKITPRMLKEYENEHDISHIMQPDIAYQLFTEEPEAHEKDSTLVKCGDTVYAPIFVDIPPQDVQPFSTLFNNIDQGIPWRMSILIETGHANIISKIGTKKAMTSILKFTSSTNKLIHDACDELLNLVDRKNVLASCSMSFCTWGKDYKQARRRKSNFAQAIQSWGYTGTIDEKGDSIKLWVETIPALVSSPISTQAPYPLNEILKMLPLTRPASPWTTGSVLYRSMDNKLFPYQPGSSDQTTWVDLYFAPPGFGKSVKLASDNTALLTSAGNTHLPRIGLIDIGPSSANWVNMIKETLANDLRHYCAAFKIQMTADFAINPFDTPLGCRYPLSIDKSFLVNFISLLLTPAGQTSVQNIPEFSSYIVDQMYKYYDDNPRIYESGFEIEVDEAVKDTMLNVNERSSWWDIVDQLFAAGRLKEAGLAQRQAVPNLSDMTSVIAQDESLKILFGESKVLQEPLISFVTRQISLLTKDYVILAQPSMFDTGAARIISLDLQDVARTGGEQQNKQTGIMYMLARYILCKEFYRDFDSLLEMKDILPTKYVRKYIAHHKEAISIEKSIVKKLCMDEFHRTSKSPAVREQAIVDGREGRKFNVHLAIASQMIDDFDPDLVELATNIYILSKGGTEETIDKINTKFKPGKDAIAALKRDVKGPGKEGSTLLYIGKTKNKDIIWTLRLTIGSIELWSYSTTSDDVILREKLTERFGLTKALQMLASEFSGGTAKSAIDARKAQLSDDEGLENGRTIYDLIVDEFTIKYKKHLS